MFLFPVTDELPRHHPSIAKGGSYQLFFHVQKGKKKSFLLNSLLKFVVSRPFSNWPIACGGALPVTEGRNICFIQLLSLNTQILISL